MRLYGRFLVVNDLSPRIVSYLNSQLELPPSLTINTLDRDATFSEKRKNILTYLGFTKIRRYRAGYPGLLFFAINPDQIVTAFRSQFEAPDLPGLRTNQEQFGEDSCSSVQYKSAVKTFTKNPDPLGTVMNWVCRNNSDYLDLNKYPLELNPRP